MLFLSKKTQRGLTVFSTSTPLLHIRKDQKAVITLNDLFVVNKRDSIRNK